jgi:uncharacterized protein DUF4365
MRNILDIVADSDWFEAVPPLKAQEWVSLAYLQAVIAQAGLNVLHCAWDDGIDLHIGATKKLALDLPRNVFVALQVKSSQDWLLREGMIVFALDQRAYDILRDDSEMPQLLILYTLPPEREKWLVQHDEHTSLHNCAYFYSLKGHPATENTDSTTIKIPVGQRLTKPALIRIFQELASERGYARAAE